MTSKLYGLAEGDITWSDSGSDLAFTLNNLPTVTGRQGAVKDLGLLTTPRAVWFNFVFWCQFETTPVLGDIVRVYEKVGNGTQYGNDDGTGDIAVSSEDKLKNLHQIATLVVDEAAAGITMAIFGGPIYLPERYFNPIVWIAAADNLKATANVSGFILSPFVYQGQAT